MILCNYKDLLVLQNLKICLNFQKNSEIKEFKIVLIKWIKILKNRIKI